MGTKIKTQSKMFQRFSLLLAVCLTFFTTGVVADNFRCVNYCNMTYDFDTPCAAIITAFVQSAGNQTDYAVTKQTSSMLHVVHATTSQCCPIGHLYFEDLTFTFDAQHDGGCTVDAYSVSRDGTCDFGQDITNILTLVDFA